MQFHGKTAIITGAAKGIGKEIALMLAEQGAYVVVVDIGDASEVIGALQERNLQGMALQVDITDYSAVEIAVREILDRRGSIDILVNNAGIVARGTILTMSIEQWKRVMEVNVNGTYYFCKAAIPSMISQKSGKIVNITSIAAKTGDLTAAPAYGASKGAVSTLTRSLARQVAQYGITVNAVAPHAIETDMSAEWSEEKRTGVVESLPVKRMGTPREVAAAVCYLASDDAAFVTGETLNVNGGYLMD
ncbi:MAG TPA: short-chain dehydrogenase [Sphaerochaeta sp.]|nr:MAG: short-chain dehydrogenase [Spirochaetes bacterium GWF2_52_7]PKL19731.1 MAG: short-chain dehydrogenase [Spirochaetae bacterium HGW-Spirochaetae-4]HCJ95121.1 short-chain dehydrogenase [Sphaerochaeta sp.]HCS36017.1 short-chain dehydrogenase [Sphaerochaeta sp.]